MSSHMPTPSDSGVPMQADGMAPGYGPMGPSGPPDPGLMRYINAIFRYKWMILLLGLLGSGVGLAAIQFVTPTYNTVGRISMLAGLVGGNPGSPIRAGQLLSTDSWGEFVRSGPVMDTVIRDLKLYLEPGDSADSALFEDITIAGRPISGQYRLNVNQASGEMTLVDGNGIERSRAAIGDTIGTEVGITWVPPAALLGSRRQVQFAVRSFGEVRGDLVANLRISPTEAGDILRFYLAGKDRAKVAETVNALMERFILVAAEFKAVKLRESANLLGDQHAAADSALKVADEEYQRFRVATITLPTDEPGVPIATSQSTEGTILSSYFAREAKLDELRRDKAALEGILASPPGEATQLVTRMEFIPSVGANAVLSGALRELGDHEITLRSLLTTFTDAYPEVVQVRAARDSLQHNVIPEYTRQLVATITAKIADDSAVIASQERELRNIPPRMGEQTRLERRRNAAAGLVQELESKRAAAELAARETAVPDMSILDPASEPNTPLDDKRPQILLMCIVAGFGLGVLGALLRDRFDPRLRYPSEVTSGMGLHILGAVPALRRGRIGSGDMALAVEAFRAIQLSLSHAHGAHGNGNGNGPMAITFTSPGASDGKSFVTSNLAIAFADMGYRTLVIDGDVRRGSLHRLLGTTHKPGLTDFLVGKVTRADIVRTTRYPMLDIIGCGSRGEQGPKLLGSPAMSRLVQELKSDYDVILIDSPPLGACVDPMVLGTLTKNLVLVLRTGTTDRSMAESKLDVLDRLPVRVLGAILNDVSQNGPYRYYAYVSGYEVLEEVEPGGDEIKQLGGGDGASADEI